jgi:hypothetical protein
MQSNGAHTERYNEEEDTGRRKENEEERCESKVE